MLTKIHIATAGWSIPREQQSRFPVGESHLARYAKVFDAVEINSTFYRAHRAETFERWASTVPRAFRFSVKLPRTITHDQRLVGSARVLAEFLDTVAGLGSKLGCLLVQLPPSLVFDAGVARTFLGVLRRRFDRGVALEPRHASWFEPRADRLLSDHEIARVSADPSPVAGHEPGGWTGLAYIRLHGSPKIYYSSYEKPSLDTLVVRLSALRRRRIPAWCVFDNTALGAATADALSVLERLAGHPAARTS